MTLQPKPCVSFEFEVEKIIGISGDGRYQVQWAPAWVSKFHLVGCEHLIQDFLAEQKQQQHAQNQQEQETEQIHELEACSDIIPDSDNDNLAMNADQIESEGGSLAKHMTKLVKHKYNIDITDTGIKFIYIYFRSLFNQI